MPLPKILTAIPKRRYQFGPYEAVVLGDIESSDSVRYRFILALVRVGHSKPSLYVTAESGTSRGHREVVVRMRVVSEEAGEEQLAAEGIQSIDDFAAAALAAAGQALGLAGITPVRTM